MYNQHGIHVSCQQHLMTRLTGGKKKVRDFFVYLKDKSSDEGGKVEGLSVMKDKNPNL